MVRTSTTMPNVSIVLPVFNGENKYLADTVKSVLNQSHEDFELIIIDDGSTDHTFSLLSDLSRSDSRIRLLQNEKNEGLV
jgi:glycosyltransferase involved in cell wall biosynthesis